MIIGDYLEIPEPIEEFMPPKRPVKAPGGGPLTRRIVDLWNGYGGAIGSESDKRGLAVGLALSVFAVETSGLAFEKKRCVIRVEKAVFAQYLPVNRVVMPIIQNGNQDESWGSLAAAARINLEGALLSTSWGLPQIMGFNAVSIGYDNVRLFVHAMCARASTQVEDFFKFLEVNRLVEVAKARDWQAFAKKYNGPGNVPVYRNLLFQAAAEVDRLEAGGLTWGHGAG